MKTLSRVKIINALSQEGTKGKGGSSPYKPYSLGFVRMVPSSPADTGVGWNRPFAGSGHMVRNKLRWDANDAVGLPKQRKVGLDWYEFLCFGRPTASFASQRDLFRTM